MIWDRVAPLYDVVVNTANRAVYAATGRAVARLIHPGDTVLECACGTGAITRSHRPHMRLRGRDRLLRGDAQAGTQEAREILERHRRAGGYHRLALRNDSFDAAWRATSSTCCLNRAMRSRNSSGSAPGWHDRS